jgi:hypothetical protein
MNTETKPVAKSLHTVTVIVQVARRIRTAGQTDEHAVDEAMTVLGLAGREDPWGTRTAALKQIAPKA